LAEFGDAKLSLTVFVEEIELLNDIETAFERVLATKFGFK
jgi:hypothetical protein